MPTTAINALPYPDGDDPPNAPVQIANLAAQLDSRLVARFANVAARDAAIPAPVDGMICAIAAQVSPALPSRTMVYKSGAWRLLGPTPLAPLGGAWTEPPGQFGAGVPVGGIVQLTYLDVPDPGFPYRVTVMANCEVGSVAAGTRWDMWVAISNSSNNSPNFDYNIANEELTNWQRINTGVSINEYTGSLRVVVQARRAYGSANGEITGTNKKVSVYRHAS